MYYWIPFTGYSSVKFCFELAGFKRAKNDPD